MVVCGWAPSRLLGWEPWLASWLGGTAQLGVTVPFWPVIGGPGPPTLHAMPGEDEKEQLACIMEVLGKPPSDIALYSARAPIFFDPGEGGG